MGPAVLVTLGLLFLLSNTSEYPFERTWPILLIVIGAIKVGRYVVGDEGHINPGQYPPGPYGAPYGQYPPGYVAGVQYGAQNVNQNANQNAAQNMNQNAVPTSGPVVTPPPPPIAGELGDGQSAQGEVHNG
jgi:hypothetical protein